MTDHKACPNCNDPGTEVVHTEYWTDQVRRTRICHQCPTEFVVSYGHPEIVEETQHD